jgi:hypothetical protein
MTPSLNTVNYLIPTAMRQDEGAVILETFASVGVVFGLGLLGLQGA